MDYKFYNRLGEEAFKITVAEKKIHWAQGDQIERGDVMWIVTRVTHKTRDDLYVEPLMEVERV